MSFAHWIARRTRQLAALPRATITYSSATRRASDGPPIFVIGSTRSGTTLLRKILNAHSRIACPGESWFLYTLLQQVNNPHVAKGLLSLDVHRDEVMKNIREYALHTFEGYLQRSGKARWADKTPHYTLIGEEIVELFGEVRFLHCLRHGMDVANSMKDWWWVIDRVGEDADEATRIEEAARQWVKFTECADALAEKHPSLVHTVRYEELLRDPEGVMRAALSFVGEAWEPEMIDYQAFPQRGFGDPKSGDHGGIDPTNVKKYLAWPADVRDRVQRILGHQLERYGYTVEA